MTEAGAGAAGQPGTGQAPYEHLDAPALRALLAERDRALAEMAAAHDEFLHAVSHDLRAPLRHIVSFGPLVRELVEDEAQGLPAEERAEACSFLGTMDQASRRMGRMLDGLLALSRIAHAPLHLAPVDLNALAREAQATLDGEAAGRSVEWQFAPGLPTVAGDAALLRQLLTELLGNALKFTRDRSPARIAVSGDVAVDGTARLEVRDNGTGFDPARAGALFGVFQRLHREADFDGMGVGLAKARAIMQRHRGRIGIDAVPGEGCTLTLEWPPGGGQAARP
ncbi:sensor histidine kinase [Acidovorax sacchari]|uniref:sensor histidine kinase n=1 Tax=Acidovorax sacchari TaxID=3230736 RepID=UPI0039E64BFA